MAYEIQALRKAFSEWEAPNGVVKFMLERALDGAEDHWNRTHDNTLNQPVKEFERANLVALLENETLIAPLDEFLATLTP